MHSKREISRAACSTMASVTTKQLILVIDVLDEAVTRVTRSITGLPHLRCWFASPFRTVGSHKIIKQVILPVLVGLFCGLPLQALQEALVKFGNLVALCNDPQQRPFEFGACTILHHPNGRDVQLKVRYPHCCCQHAVHAVLSCPSLARLWIVTRAQTATHAPCQTRQNFLHCFI
jgi:hypothetical protein